MEDNWDEYRSDLRRMFFGDEQWKLAERDSEIEQLFLKFLSKIRERLKRKNTARIDPPNTETKCNHLGVPEGSFDRTLTVRLSLQLPDMDYDLRQIPPNVLKEFSYVITSFIAFENKMKLNKLKNLRASQANLPIASKRDEILQTLLNSQVVIIAGDTGCGKSTQVAQYLLEADYDCIACTQPRRIAATSLARRVAYETLDEYGSKIAYQTRFEKTRTLRTRLLFLTEGLLLRQMQVDKEIRRYNVIILDEVHERNLSSDFLIGLLRDLVHRRSDLKLILMSATINLELFQNYFTDAPVSGRLFPIELQYIPTNEYSYDSTKKKQKIDPTPYLKVLQMIDGKISSSERGDALIFLNGISEITTVAEALKVYAEATKNWIILILHSSLSSEEQDKVFDIAPPGVRKCIVSTNIAETSVTIDQVRFVIDSGKVNLLKYDSKSGMHSLREYWVSQASAEQRKGRAGRTGPGVCYRLYSKDQFDKMDPFTISEINRVSLESVVMQIVHMDVQMSPLDFPFIERPNVCALNEAVESLIGQGVLDKENMKLTPLGNIIANIPVDIPIAKLLIYGCILNENEVALSTAACLSVSTVFSVQSSRDADTLRRRDYLISYEGDLFTFVNVFREFIKRQSERHDMRKWCREKGIDIQRMFEICQLRDQFKELLETSGVIEKREEINSKERRIDAGDRKRLSELKRDARFETKKRKILKAESHFDLPFNEGETTTFMDDIYAMEFYVKNRDSGVKKILDSHLITEERKTVIQFMVAAAFYPRYAILDQYNHYKPGCEMFAHTRKMPFVVMHPNGSIATFPEEFAYKVDDKGFSREHRLVTFASFMETTKPFLCNSVRIPALLLVLVAKSVDCSSGSTILCDDFIKLEFTPGCDFFAVAENAGFIRRELNYALRKRLDGDIAKNRKLIKNVKSFIEMNAEYKMTRRACPNENLELAFILPSGEKLLETESEGVSDLVSVVKNEPEEDPEEAKEDISKNRVKYYCEFCKKTLYLASNFEILRHKKLHA